MAMFDYPECLVTAISLLPKSRGPDPSEGRTGARLRHPLLRPRGTAASAATADDAIQPTEMAWLSQPTEMA